MFIVFCSRTVFCCVCVCVCVIREEPVSLNNSLKMFGHEGGSTCVFISNATLTSFLCLQTRFYTQPAHLSKYNVPIRQEQNSTGKMGRAREKLRKSSNLA